MKKLKIICLNGPPRAGKDTAAEIITDFYANHKGMSVVNMKFAQPLNAIAGAVLSIDELSPRFKELRERRKDDIIDTFGVTMRQLLINISEKLIKPTFGEGYFGTVAAMNVIDVVRRTNTDVVVFSDSGFQCEYDTLKDTLDDAEIEYDIHLVRVHRGGCTFEKDSREWVSDYDNMQIINNFSSMEVLAAKIHLTMEKL